MNQGLSLLMIIIIQVKYRVYMKDVVYCSILALFNLILQKAKTLKVMMV